MIYRNLQSGFSLVETLVAITILLLVIVGPLTIVSTTTNSTTFSNEQVIAFFLAQEGAELAQKARDDMVINRFLDISDGNYNATPWTDFSDDSNGAAYEDCFNTNSVGCGLEVDEDSAGSIETPVDCSANTCNLYYDSNTNNVRSRYTYTDTGNLTPYKRVITFENINASEIRVVSRVEWFSGLTRQPQTAEVITYLFDVYGD